jgi:hypothetical protein
VLTVFYVDEGLVAARTVAGVDALVELVGSIFEIKALRELKDFPGIEICRDLAVGTITISQESKALALAKLLGVTRPRRTLPLSSETMQS